MDAFIELHHDGDPVTLRAGSIHGIMPHWKDGHALLVCEGAADPVGFDESYGEVKELLRRAGCRVVNGRTESGGRG